MYLLLLGSGGSCSRGTRISSGRYSYCDGCTTTRASVQDEILNVPLLTKLSKETRPIRVHGHIRCVNQRRDFLRLINKKPNQLATQKIKSACAYLCIMITVTAMPSSCRIKAAYVQAISELDILLSQLKTTWERWFLLPPSKSGGASRVFAIFYMHSKCVICKLPLKV